MATTTTGWRISPAAWVPIGLAIVAEATSNALRAYGLGTHLEAFTFHHAGVTISIAGAVLVLAAVAVSLSQARAAWVALTPGDVRQRIISGFAAVLLLSISVTAMASHLLEAQRAKVSDEAGQRDDYDREKRKYGRLLIQLETLQKYGADGKQLPRAAGVIQAAIDNLPIDMRVWRRTKRCTDVTMPESKEACRDVLAHYEERGARIALDRLQPKLEAAEAALAKLERPEKVQEAEAVVAGGWSWIMGLGVVFVATFGPVIFAHPPPAHGAATPTLHARGPGPSESDSAQTSFPAANVPDFPDGSGGGGIRRPRAGVPGPAGVAGGVPVGKKASKSEVERFVVTELALGRTIPSQQALTERFGRSKSTVSDWLKDWERRGVIPARTQAGRCKMLAGE